MLEACRAAAPDSRLVRSARSKMTALDAYADENGLMGHSILLKMLALCEMSLCRLYENAPTFFGGLRCHGARRVLLHLPAPRIFRRQELAITASEWAIRQVNPRVYVAIQALGFGLDGEWCCPSGSHRLRLGHAKAAFSTAAHAAMTSHRWTLVCVDIACHL